MAFNSTPVQQVTVAEASTASIVFNVAALTLHSTVVIGITVAAGSTASYPSAVAQNNGGTGTFTVFTVNTAVDGPPPYDRTTGVNDACCLIYCLDITAGGATTITVTMSALKTAGGVLTEWNPNGATVSVDSSKHGGGGTAATAQPDIPVTSTGDGLVISAHRSGGVLSAGPNVNNSPAGWTAATSQPATACGISWQVFTGAQTAVHPGWTSASAAWGSVTVAFKTTSAAVSDPMPKRSYRLISNLLATTLGVACHA